MLNHINEGERRDRLRNRRCPSLAEEIVTDQEPDEPPPDPWEDWIDHGGEGRSDGEADS